MSMAAEARAQAAHAAPESYLGADELLAGSAATYDIEEPAALIEAGRSGLAGRVQLRPLTVRDVQLISRAARDSDSLAGALMVHAALQVPALSLPQVSALPIGLMEFLLAEVNRISGLAVAPAALEEAAEQPIARAAIRWMRRNPPPPAQKISVVHGDYRTGNFLFDGEGTIRAILDWEMCHLGDPLEDVAWAADPLWAFQDTERPGGMIARDEAFRLWEEAGGMKIDPIRLRWWEIFNSLKGLAIWISSGKEYQSGASSDPILAFPSWYCTDVHNRVLAHRLAALSKEARA